MPRRRRDTGQSRSGQPQTRLDGEEVNPLPQPRNDSLVDVKALSLMIFVDQVFGIQPSTSQNLGIPPLVDRDYRIAHIEVPYKNSNPQQDEDQDEETIMCRWICEYSRQLVEQHHIGRWKPDELPVWCVTLSIEERAYPHLALSAIIRETLQQLRFQVCPLHWPPNHNRSDFEMLDAIKEFVTDCSELFSQASPFILVIAGIESTLGANNIALDLFLDWLAYIFRSAFDRSSLILIYNRTFDPFTERLGGSYNIYRRVWERPCQEVEQPSFLSFVPGWYN